MLFWRVLLLVLILGVSAKELMAQIPNIGPIEPIKRAGMGFSFTEGPASDIDGNVYFTDVATSRIHKLDLQGRVTTFLENSQGCNGLIFDSNNKLLACQGNTGRIISIDINSKNISVLADSFQNKRFDRPNDIVIDGQGGIYFSDPVFSGPMVQDKMGVYYLSTSGQVTRIIDNLSRPNGVILSPDEKTLYVLSGQPTMMVYPVTSPGQIGQGRTITLQSSSNGDGMTVDSLGNIYVTRPGISAIEVISPDGRSLGLIQFPEAPSNCTFGGADLKTLYVTARTSIYTAKMAVTGHRFATNTFNLGVNPTSQTVVAGMSASFDISVQALGMFSDLVNLSVTSPNNQITAILSQNSLMPGTSAMLTINTDATTPLDTYNLTLSATSGSITKSQQISLLVTSTSPSPDFSLSFNPATVTIARGKKADLMLNIQRIAGFADSVTVTAPSADIQKSLKIKITPSTQSSSSTSVSFSLKTKKKAVTGMQQIIFTGTDSSGRVRTTTLNLMITQ